MKAIFQSISIGFREAIRAYRNIKRMNQFDRAGKFSPF